MARAGLEPTPLDHESSDLTFNLSPPSPKRKLKLKNYKYKNEWGEWDSNPREHNSLDLQSNTVNHLVISPKKISNNKLKKSE